MTVPFISTIDRRPIVLAVAGTSWFVSLALFLAGFLTMYYITGLSYIAPRGSLDSSQAYHTGVYRPSDQERFRRELAAFSGLGEEDKVLGILKWVMNQVSRTENFSAASSWEMVEMGRSNRGLLCAGMAQIFRDALLASGIPARKVILQRNLFDNRDTHVTVEAWVAAKWRMYDPTFHIVFLSGSERVGVFEAREWFLKGKGRPVQIQFLGEVTYPARVASYPIRYEALLDNAYVELRRTYPSALQAIADKGVWLGPRHVNAYPVDQADLSENARDLYRVFFFTVIVILPLVNVASLILVLMLWISRRRS